MPQLTFKISHTSYHADPAPMPSLSASIATKLVTRSPRHAWFAHPRLNPHWQAAPTTDEMDDGTALHTLFLGRGPELLLVPEQDWRSDTARYLRIKARREGKVPVLRRRLEQLQECALAARRQLQGVDAAAGLFAAGNAEAMCIWPEGRQFCRLLLDWMPEDPREAVYDLKFTSGSAAPADWERHVWSENALRVAFYERGLLKTRGVAPKEYRLVVIEISPPYGTSIFAAANDVIEYGRDQVRAALALWAGCRSARQWPGYQTTVNHVELPPWKRQEFEEGGGAPRIAPPQRKKKASPAQVAQVQRIAADMGLPSVS